MMHVPASTLAREHSVPAYGGLPIVFSEACLKATNERLFPKSCHRSRRIHKKLVKRFGGEFRKRPAMFLVRGQLYAHPMYRAELMRQLAAI